MSKEEKQKEQQEYAIVRDFLGMHFRLVLRDITKEGVYVNKLLRKSITGRYLIYESRPSKWQQIKQILFND